MNYQKLGVKYTTELMEKARKVADYQGLTTSSLIRFALAKHCNEVLRDMENPTHDKLKEGGIEKKA